MKFRAGWAWCALCVSQDLHLQPHLLYALETDAIRARCINAHGILFYVPRAYDGPAKNALDYYESSNPDGAIAVPAGNAPQ